jgi:uncharacterized protein YfaQ (DUF2300 family)
MVKPVAGEEEEVVALEARSRAATPFSTEAVASAVAVVLAEAEAGARVFLGGRVGR